MVSPHLKGLEHPGVLDALAHDSRSDLLILAMYEYRPWSGGESQLFQLQEKLNAYVSFALDGELAEAYPEFQNKKIVIQLRTVEEPDEAASGFIARVREQLAFQNIGFDVVLIEAGKS